jgi:hypothetical protein
MSGQSLLNRVLVDKEKALGRKELVNAYIGLATSFMLTAAGYSTLTYLAALPALSRSPGEVEPPVKSSGASTSALNEPESGVKLLLSIISRLGNSGDQIAMAQDGENRWAYKPNVWGGKAKQHRDTGLIASADQLTAQPRSANASQFNQGLSLNAADPALSIRPQLNKRASLDDFAGNQQSQQYQQSQQTPSQTQQSPSQSQQSQAQSQLSQLQTQSNLRARNLNQATWYKAPSSIKIISESPDIKEFAPASKAEAASDNKKSVSRRQVNIVDEPLGRTRTEQSNLIEQSKDLASSAGADSVTGIIRPSEQPGLFKYVREYYKESLKNMPPPASMPAGTPLSIPQILDGSPIVTDSRAIETNEAGARFGGGAAGGAGGGAGGKGISAVFDADKEMGRGFQVSNFRPIVKKHAAAVQIAFLPPNAVHGINGLSLGSSTTETMAFLKSRGKVSKVVISGFQIFTLKGERGTPLLQAFVRDQRLEALRVFSGTYVPPQLGVNLGEDLPSMKAKFGEPAFILEEPRVKDKAPPVVAKNYVYPVSQVSFQLSRPHASSTPQVLSMLLFRFL